MTRKIYESKRQEEAGIWGKKVCNENFMICTVQLNIFTVIKAKSMKKVTNIACNKCDKYNVCATFLKT
jgi:hypothetical protein